MSEQERGEKPQALATEALHPDRMRVMAENITWVLDNYADYAEFDVIGLAPVQLSGYKPKEQGGYVDDRSFHQLPKAARQFLIQELFRQVDFKLEQSEKVREYKV